MSSLAAGTPGGTLRRSEQETDTIISRTVCVVSLVAFLCAPSSHAGADAQGWHFVVTTFLDAAAQFGTLPDALDGYDPNDLYAAGYISFRRVQGQDWDGSTGYLAWDYRAPLEDQFGASKTWTALYVTHSTVLDPTVKVYFAPSTSARPPVGWLYELYLDEVPDGIVYDGPCHWHLDPTLWNMIELPPANYDPAKPIPQGYRFSIKVTVIPEPCSLIAMGVGLAALGLRRKR